MSTAPVADLIGHMLTALDNQIVVYERLGILMDQQVAALNAQDPQGVHDSLQEIERVMIDRAQLEFRRSEILRALSLTTGVPESLITASYLQELSSEDVAQRIAQCSQRLHELIKRLDVVVDQSRALLEQELQVIEHVVDAVTLMPEPTAYAATGGSTPKSRRSLLDTQV